MYERAQTWIEPGPQLPAGRRRGMGDTTLPASTCGANPCGFLDWIWVSDACCNYLQCANPSDPRIFNLNASCNAQGPLLPAVGTEIGQTVGNAVGSTVGTVGQSIADTTSTGTSLALIGIGVLALFLLADVAKGFK